MSLWHFCFFEKQNFRPKSIIFGWLKKKICEVVYFQRYWKWNNYIFHIPTCNLRILQYWHTLKIQTLFLLPSCIAVLKKWVIYQNYLVIKIESKHEIVTNLHVRVWTCNIWTYESMWTWNVDIWKLFLPKVNPCPKNQKPPTSTSALRKMYLL